MSERDERSDAVEIARQDLVHTLHYMPFGAGVWKAAMPMLNSDESETEFLAQVTQWLRILADVLQAVSETNTSMVDELHELRHQKQAIRDFLGLNPTAEKGTPA